MAAAASPVPLVLYNPPHAKRVLTPSELARLCAAVPAITGLKVGGGDAAWYQAMRPLMERVSVFVPGHDLASGYRQGAAGAYSNVACLNPRAAVTWWETMPRDPDAALAVEERLRAFLDECVVPLQRDRGYCNAALDKLLAAVGGWCPLPTRLRWPYAGVPDADVAAVRAAAAERLPEFVEAG
jgi:4-hydroxy-tetrahydrodipicolinate synthase